MYRQEAYKSKQQYKKMKYLFFMSTCLEALVRVVWLLSKRPPDEVVSAGAL